MSIYIDHLRQSKGLSTLEAGYLKAYDRGDIDQEQLRRIEFLWERKFKLHQELLFAMSFTITIVSALIFFAYIIFSSK